MTTREELVGSVKAAQAVHYAAFATAGNDPFGPGVGDAYRAYLRAQGALEAYDDASAKASQAAQAARSTSRRSDGRVVRRVGRKAWTEY